MEFVFQNFLFSGVCLVRSLSRQEFVFQKFVFSGVCLSGVCLSGVCLSGVCHGAVQSAVFFRKNVVQKFAFSSVKVLRRETLPSPQLEKVKQAIAKCNT